MHQPSYIKSRSASADHNYLAAPVPLDIGMMSTVRPELQRQIREALGNVLEVGNADCQNDTPRMNYFAAVETHNETLRLRFDADYCFVFQFRHLSGAECKAVGRKRLEAGGRPFVKIWDSVLGTKAA